LKLQDVNLEKQQLYVALPTKNGQPRTVFFSTQTNKYLQQWLKERDPECGHDRLLYGFRKLPFSPVRLHNEIAMAVCKEYPGREPIPDGFEKWSTHRLRHTFATTMANNGASAASLMALGGWRSSKAMAGYTRIDPDTARRSYTEAMRKSREKSTSTTRSMTMSQYLESRAPHS
jgi:integrase